MDDSPEKENLKDSLKGMTMVIASIVRDEMEDFHCEYLDDSQMKELNPLIRNAIYSGLFIMLDDSPQSKMLRNCVNPPASYWEEPEFIFEKRKDFDESDLEESLGCETMDFLRGLLDDIWIESPSREDLNDLDKGDLIVGILEWVKVGVEGGNWTYKSWYESVMLA